MKQVATLSGLLAVALVGSYLTWTDDGSGRARAEAVPLYAASAADLQTVTWKSEKADIELSRRTDAGGDYMWVVATERKKRRADAADDAAPAEDAEPVDAEDAEDAEPSEPEMIEVEEVTAFLGNKSADETWASFAPLLALRELGRDLDRSALGFDEPEATLVVQRRSGPLELVVGGEAYGSKDRYVLGGDTVYLVDDAVIRPLQYATTRMVERTLHPLAEKDITGIEVTLPDGRALSLQQHHRDDRARAFWARAESPEAAEDAAGTWLGKVFRMRINAYLTDDAVEEPLEPVFTYAVTGEGKTWQVEVLREASGDRRQYYARSSFNRSLVRLTITLAQDAAADLDAIFGS